MERNERNQMGKAEHKINPPLEIVGLLLLLVVFLLVVVTVVFNSGSSPSFSSPMSEQLQKYSEILQRELNLTDEILFPLEVDPLADIMKYHLNPIKDRLASIRTQVRGYESMSSKVPGGPAHFISTSLAELNHIRSNQFPKCDEEVLRILEQTITNNKLQSSNHRELKKNKNAWEGLMKETMYSLPAEGITFTPSSMRKAADENYEEEYQYYINQPGSARESMANLAEIERTLRTLSEMFRQREGIVGQITDLLRPHGFAGSTREDLYEFFQLLGDNRKGFFIETGIDALITEHNAIAQAIHGEIDKHNGKLQMTIAYFAQLINRINILSEKLENRAHHNDVYLTLRSDILGDLEKLVKRVLALKTG